MRAGLQLGHIIVSVGCLFSLSSVFGRSLEARDEMSKEEHDQRIDRSECTHSQACAPMMRSLNHTKHCLKLLAECQDARSDVCRCYPLARELLWVREV